MAFIRIARTLTLMLAVLSSAHAAYPEKPIRLVVPFAAGSGLDKVARTTALRLSQQLGQPVVVDNVVGAGGTLGVDHVLAAPRDGYTLLFATTGTMVINPHVYKRLRHAPLKDLRVISPVYMATNVLVVRRTLPVNTLAEFVAYARANPGKLTFGSSGVGSSSHLAGSMLQKMAGIEMIHVPYRGSAAASADFLGERLDVMLDSASQYVALAEAGKVKVLGVTSQRRFPDLPQWPTLGSAGLPGFDVTIWNAIMAASGTPQPAVNALRQAMSKVVSDPGFRVDVAPGAPMTMSPAEFEKFIVLENDKWKRLAQESGASDSQ